MQKILFIAFTLLILSCSTEPNKGNTNKKEDNNEVFDWSAPAKSSMDKLVHKYIPFTLTSDLKALSDKQKNMIPKLVEASLIMDQLFWYEAYGDQDELLNQELDLSTKEFVKINYGPWDRLNGNKPFVKGVGEKAKGANFYPKDMSKEEFEKSSLKDKSNLYTFIERDLNGDLVSIPYHVKFEKQVTQVSRLLMEASELAEDPGLKKYLSLRSQAILTDKYQDSDMAWLDMKDNTIDIVIGPIETYEDQLFGYKAAHEAYVLIKDKEWSNRLKKYAAFLPDLQKGLPVTEEYKSETPGRDTELNAYDVVFYAGDCNAGSKTIAINLPNDEEVQLKKGTRRLQLKNAMRAKFDQILNPIADELIDPSQRGNVKFDAFFANTMFHEVAHGLGIKNTIDGKGSVRKALKEHASALEEGKADMLGLYMINQLLSKGELDGDIKDYIVTFMAGIFRSVRFGASSAHGKANMIRFNFFDEMGAFTRDNTTGKYTVNFDRFQVAMEALSKKILTLQGDGDYDGVADLVARQGVIKDQLKADLNRLSNAGIPVDVVFNQGLSQLDL